MVYGGASAPGTNGVLDLSALNGANGFILNGIDVDDFSGRSVSSAGDVNGDGYDDLIIGAWQADPNGSRSGETYVVYGGASVPGTAGVLDLSMLDGSNGFILNGIDERDLSGNSVSSAGDVNGDGYDDLIIGARRADPGGDDEGETYVVYGGASAPGTGGVLELSTLDGTNGFTLNGVDRSDYSGASVSSAGDVNGDGYDDLIIGAYGPYAGDGGKTHVVYGGASAPGTRGVLELSALDGTNGFTLNGIDEYDDSGISVSSAGDVNGDGYDDLIIGAYQADPGGNAEGETYVVYGGAGAPGVNGVLELSALDGTNGFTLAGIDATDRSGVSVSSAGDVNGDGYDDLIIGARVADPNGDNSGETYVVYGGASAPGTAGVLDLSMLDGSNGFILNGIDASDFSSNSVSSAGDVNGDGYDDLIIGARSADPHGSSSGETYVVYGGKTGTESTAPVTAQGTAAADNFTGNGGADSFTDIATGDVVRGGPGNDSISVTSLDFADIDGGTGEDRLVLDGSNLSLDLTGPGNAGVDSVEVVDLSGTGANTLLLDALALFDLTEERVGGIATLDVLGDADDTVDLTGGNFTANGTATEDGTTYNVYRDGNAEVRVETGVQIQIPGATAPVFTSPATAGVAENQSLAYTAVATDADEEPLTYSLSGTDAALFTIDATTGAVSFITPPDFENPGDAGGDNVYNITVTASDDTNQTPHDVTITVTNENDNAPIFNSPATAGVAENHRVDTLVYMAMATDADGDGLTYSLSGADAARFTIDPATGAVRFVASPDFENPDDAGGNNVYDITVTASDDTNNTPHDVAITVTNENDNAPSFTSPGSASVAENQTLAYTALATDGDGDTLTYSLSGTDAARFTIDPNTGAVRFIASPDFENPDDAGGNNIYDIIVTASDNTGGTTDTNQAVAITVTGVNDNAPVFNSPATASVEENQTAAYTALATDADGDALSYSLSGTDAARFTINAATGVVSFSEAPDFENPGDVGGNNVYDIIVTASDGTTANDIDQAVAITVTGVNDNAPVFSSPATASVAENQTTAYIGLARDADGDPLTYSLSGTDAARFTINAATGVVRFSEAPDFENPGDAGGDNVYNIIVTASDNTGGTPDTNQAVTITVTNSNDNTPSFTSGAIASVAENQTAAYTAQATDGDGDTLTYSLSGTDAARFTINPTTGAVSFIAPPDFENPNDAGTNNVYNITVTASDDTNNANRNVTITVTNENDNHPVFTSGNSAGVPENQSVDSVVYTAMATDADGDTLSYRLSGTDAALFTIDPTTGAVRFIASPDFEEPGDDGGDNVYDIIVTASDNTNNTDQAVAVTVTDVDDGTVERTEFDDNGDGVPDRIETSFFDANGLQTRTEFDDNADGVTDRSETYSYDSSDNRIRADFDTDNDGTADRVEHYDANGNVIRQEFDDNDDGTVDRSEKHMIGARGNLFRVEFDDNNNGEFDRRETYHYDDMGNRLSADFDDGADNDIDRIETYTYDVNGNRIRIDFDDNANRDTDRIEHYTFDQTGRLIRTDFDTDADGTVDRAEFDADGDGTAERIERYDAGGNVIRRELDNNDDGTVDRRETYTYDAEGNRTRAEIDTDADNDTDRIETYTYDTEGNRIRTNLDTNADGRVDRIEFDADADGHVEQVEIYSYSSSGRLRSVRTNFDADGDGHIERSAFDDDGDGDIERILHFDADNIIIRRETDTDGDGRIDEVRIAAEGDRTVRQIEHYTYGAGGNRIRTDFDDNADGTIERAEHYSYDTNGIVNRVGFDDEADGTIDRYEHYTYDSNGNIERVGFDNNANDIIELYGFDDDANGTIDRAEFDFNEDGTIDRRSFFFYDANGHRIRNERDDDVDGDIDAIEHYTVNASGTRIRTEWDTDADGRIDFAQFDDNADGSDDRREFYTYGTRGNLYRVQFDDDNNGDIDRIETYNYDPVGNLIRTFFDTDADGNDDRTEHYDADGNLIRQNFDNNDDGNIDRTEHYDAGGNVIQQDFDDDGDGTNDRVERYTLDDNGNRTRTAFDTDADGNVDQVEHYNAGGIVIQRDFHDDNDATVDRIERYTYHSNGTLQRTAFDDNANGNADRIEYYEDKITQGLLQTDFDDDDDGNIDRSVFTTPGLSNIRIEYYDDSGNLAGRGENLDFDNDLEQARFLDDHNFTGNFPDQRDLEVVLMARGTGMTDLTIPDGFLPTSRFGRTPEVRIEGDNNDTLRFDMDDFNEGARFNLSGESYRSFADNNGRWSFIVNEDVMLFDLTPGAGGTAGQQSASSLLSTPSPDRPEGTNQDASSAGQRLSEEPVFKDLSLQDSIPDMQDTALMQLSVPAVTPAAQLVFAGDTPLQNDLAMILQDMEIFADPIKNGDTDMDGF